MEKELDISDLEAKEDIVEKINSLDVKENEYVKIILVGNRNFEINAYEIIKLVENARIVKIKDRTKIAYDLERMSNETTLKGLFAKEMLEKLAGSKAAQPGLNQGELRSLKINICDKETIENFEIKVKPIMENIANNSLENKKLAELKDTLLPKLMNGEIDVDKIEI